MGTISRKTAAVVAGALALAAIQSAQASLTIDYRFSANPADTSRTVTESGDVEVQVWGTVLGVGTLGIARAGFKAFSQQVGAGAFANGGVLPFGFQPVPQFSDNAFGGSISDVTVPPDGLPDIGQATDPYNALTDALARATVAPAGVGGPGYFTSQGGWTPVSGGASIKLGSIYVHVGVLTGGGTTKYNLVIPTSPNAGHNAAIWFENATAASGQSGTKASFLGDTYSTGTSVSFIASQGPVYKYAFTTHNDATLGTIHSKSLAVLGNNGHYRDPGPYNPADGELTDYAIANPNLGVGAETPVLVMVEFNLGASGLTMAQLKSTLVNAGDVAPTSIIGPGDSDPFNRRANLISAYPDFAADAAHVLLFEFDSAPGAVANGLHFGFDISGSDVFVLRTVAVPEPATAGLLAVGALGLLRRRRKCC